MIQATILNKYGQTKSSYSLPDGAITEDKLAAGVGAGWYNAKAYGAIADGASHPLSGYYASLAAAQLVYPHAIALTDELDWAAIQAAVNACGTTGGRVYLPAGTYVTNRPILLPTSSISFVGADKSRTIIKKTANDVAVGSTRTYRSGTVTDDYAAIDAILMVDHADESPCRYVTVSDMYLYDGASSTIGYGVFAPYVAYLTMERVRTYGCSNAIYTRNIFVAKFDHVVCKGLSATSGYGFRLTNDSGYGGGTSTTFKNCYADTWRYGFYLYGFNYSGFDTCAMDNCGSAATKGIAYWVYLCQGVAMINCGCEVLYGTVIAVDGGHFTCIGFKTYNINGTTATGNGYLEIGRNSGTSSSHAIFEGCNFEAFTTANNGLNLVLQNGMRLYYIGGTEPSGGNAFVSYGNGATISRIRNDDIDIMGDITHGGPIVRDTSSTTRARTANIAEVAATADTFATLFTLTVTTAAGDEDDRGALTGLLCLAGEMKDSAANVGIISQIYPVLVTKSKNGNMTLTFGTALDSQTAGAASGTAMSVQAASAGTTSILLQAKINCVDYSAGSIHARLDGLIGATSSGCRISVTEAA